MRQEFLNHGWAGLTQIDHEAAGLCLGKPSCYGFSNPSRSRLALDYHWCPVNGAVIFSIMLFFINKGKKTGVTDLKFLERLMLCRADEIRSLHSLPREGFDFIF